MCWVGLVFGRAVDLMTTLPRPCVDCGQLIGSGSRCTRCQRSADARRGSTTERGYGAEWQKLSAQVIVEEGQCRDCGTTGTATNPLTCDHIVSKALGGTDARSNLTCRCRRHNSSKGARRVG